MRIFKIILAIFFAIVLFGNVIMYFKGELNSSWNLFAFIIFVLIEVFLIRSISREKEETTE